MTVDVDQVKKMVQERVPIVNITELNLDRELIIIQVLVWEALI